ncbi:sulfite exporter TauE/SafE family protein [Geofilum rubicundum]|uniref:Probable membrane transporter protein n=1 Tax=Geofilum rubicundum JCM 15548 TaxID=1236989 RepID=A0A0E9LSR0_9BACT|nr:sulfite exporter TauE/SafE family protein [Geofilum rubicundum]GAO28617.1 hypothetical protein JCM15548_1734 [Geofilum rubicundum JCM 15548]
MWYYSSIEPVYYLLPMIGFLVGLFGSLLGGGGGFVFLPVLTLLVGVPAQMAVITTLVATLPVCLVGSFAHFRKGHVDIKVGWVFALAGLAGAFGGAMVSQSLTSFQLKLGFGIYAGVMAIKLFWDTWNRSRSLSSKGSSRRHMKSVFYGFLAGGITGTFGVSGTAPVMAGLFSMQMTLKVVVGTSILIVLVNTAFAASTHFLLGTVDLTLVAFLTAGSALGALLGPRVLVFSDRSKKTEPLVRYGYALVMLLIGVLMILG